MESVTKVEETAAVDLDPLLDAGEGPMVTLVAGETLLMARRAVLAARSPVFSAMFSHDTLESSSNEVTITDVEGPVLRELLAYCHTLRTPHPSSMTPQVLAAADKYDLSGLKTECEQQLASLLTVESAAATAVLAVRHTCPSLTKAAVAFIKANFQVLATQGWADAVHNQPKDVVEVCWLLGQPPTKIRSGFGEEETRRLIEAFEEGDVEELLELIAAGADVRTRDSDGMTALHFFAEMGYVEVVRSLVERGAEVDARNSSNETPLHFAAIGGHSPIVRLLVACSADVNARNCYERTPLQFAAWHGYEETAAFLVEAGADTEARDKDGRTYLD
ncbi:potassium channel KOR2-like [Schistocerca americana]|uniref:potassium channel KOR2-like n=1 Tax=Schistocerca americana TaxID=7009 RepID=UPI001F4F8729|nr:potassium channel KOR2-like [Schistocerca americana]XP_047003366.1 potassium channel KOR2-like [Schistocerca americana]